MMSLRFWVSIRHMSSSSSSTVTKRMELPMKALGLFPDRFSSLKLIGEKTNVSLRLEGTTLLIEGEEASVNQAMEKLSPIKQPTVQQKDMESVLTSILGEPVRVPAQDLKVTSNLPKMAGEQTWLLRSRLTNSLLLWSDTPENANRLIERIKVWSPILEDFSAHKNFRKEVPVHPSFRWADRHAAFADIDAIVEVFPQTARIWAADDASVEKAVQILSSPYRRSQNVQMEPLAFRISSADSSSMEALKSAANKLVIPGDDSIALAAIDEAKSEIVFNTFLPSRQVIPAFQKALDKVFADRKLSTAYMNLASKDTAAIGLQDVSKTYNEVKGFTVDVATGPASSCFLALVGPNQAQVNASRGLFTLAGSPDQLKLEIKGMPKLKNDISKHFVRIVEENVLGWKDSRGLRYWGDGVFTVTAGMDEDRKRVLEDWSKLVIQTVEKPDSTSPQQLSSTDFKVAYWHASPTLMLVVGEQANVNEYVQKLSLTTVNNPPAVEKKPLPVREKKEKSPAAEKKPEPVVPKKEKLGPSTDAPSSFAEEKKPAKVTRITVPAVDEEEQKIKVTRITPPPPPAAVPHAETGKRPVKVTRITVPPLPEDAEPIAEEAEFEAEAGGKKANLKDRLTRTGARAARAGAREGQEGDSAIKTMTLPRKYSGLVVGKHGLVLKGIETRTKTRIQLRNGNIGEAKVVITGAASQVEIAAQEINEIIESAQEEQPVKRGRSRGDRTGQELPTGAGADRQQARSGSAKTSLFSPGYREKIYEAYKSDPERWTTEELCKHFQVTEEHLHGIMLVMKHRDEFLKRNKDDEGMVSKSLEDQMIKKCGEAVFPLPALQRPVCKPHFRFLNPDKEEEAEKIAPKFSSWEEELAYNREQYEAKRKEVPERPKPKSLQPVLEVKQSGKFQVVFQQ